MSDRSASKEGLSLQTLLISAASSVIATVVVSQFWDAGTLFFTAFVPVTVAIVSEVLRRPAEKITEVAPLVAPRVVPRVRSDRTEVREPGSPAEAEGPRVEPGAPRGRRADDPFDLYTPEGRGWLSGKVLRIGLITGLLAFVIAAVFITVSELALFDGSIGNRDRRTTLVGGSSSKKETRDAKETPTPAADKDPDATPTASPETSATPGASATPSATPSASPTPTPSPGAGATPTPTPASP